MIKVRKKIIVIIAILLLAGGYFIWRHYSSKKIDITQYRTATIQRGDLAQTVSANGTLNPVTLVSIGSSVSGKVQKIYADFNDRVTEGQILLEIDPTLYQAAVDQSTAQVKKAQANLDLANANVKRGSKLFSQHYLSRQDWDTLLQTKKSAQADLTVAQAKLNNDQTNLNYTVIRSPINGVVVDKQTDVGSTVAASFQSPVLYKIAQDLKNMQIDTSFAEADISNIKPGQEVEFTVDAFPNRTFKGVVKQIRLNPTTQQNVVTYDVVIIVDNADESLLPGMTAYVNIKVAQLKNVVLIPNAAFRFKPSSDKGEEEAKQNNAANTVYKIVAGALKRVSCKPGITDNKSSVIDACELKIGDQVVVGIKNGANLPQSGFRVRMF